MPIYEYKGLNSKGKAAAGVLDADSPRSLKEQLRRDGVFLSEYVESRGGSETRRAGQQKAGSREVKLGKYFERVKLMEVSEVTRQLATLVRSGIPVVDAITAVSDQLENPLFKRIMSQVKRSVSEGASLANALGKHPKVFSPLFVNMVGAGEQSGTLDSVFDRLADFLESQVRLRTKVRGALMYPIIMLLVAGVIISLMLLLVIPKMQDLFSKMNKDLPWLTQALVDISDFMQSFWWLIGAAMVGLFMWWNRWRKSEAGKPKWDRQLLKMPIFGSLIRMSSVARFTRTLATLLASGVPILNALSITRTVVGNEVIGNVIDDAREAVKEGQAIADPLKASGEFPSMVCHMVSVGEQSGELEAMLGNIADSYELQVETKVGALTSILEPLMIVVMGGIVAIMALAVMLPMLDMSNLGR
jgi:general secretion pathway protein F